jgi:DNA-binding transcriptional LysR family regulator
MKAISKGRTEWSDVRLFWVVAESGSFGAAARSLRLGLTTVTRAVDRLEKSLNARLLTRGPQGVSLTEAGLVAYDRALSMERVAEQLEREIADCEKSPEGRVKLLAPDGVAGIFLTPFLAEFVRANPKIDLAIDCQLWAERPLSGDADLTLTFEEPTHPEFVATPLAHFHYGLFASQEYLDLYGAPTTTAEVLAHPYVHHVGQAHHPENWAPRLQGILDLVRKRIETNCSAVSFTAVKNGAGIGAMPTAILAIEPALVLIDRFDYPSIRLWMVHHREATRSARVRRVVDWLKDMFDAKTKPWYRAEFVHPAEFGAYLGEDGVKLPAPLAAEDPSDRRQRRARII